MSLGVTVAWWAATAPRSDARPLPVPYRSVVVRPGDTLWALADRYGPPTVDPRVWIDRVERANGLRGALLRPGQVLVIPEP
jgi:nucleoid-associated protein YgaU